jgi:hypothetical protein
MDRLASYLNTVKNEALGLPLGIEKTFYLMINYKVLKH